MNDEIIIEKNEAQIEKSLAENPEVYYEVKRNIRLVIDGRFKPNKEERSLIYQLLSIHGIKWDDMD